MNRHFDTPIPTAFVLVNKTQERLKNRPGLSYYCDVEYLPAHVEWYNMLWRFHNDGGLSLSRSSTYLSSLNLDWHGPVSDTQRHQLETDGFNYVGLRHGFGPLLHSHIVNAKNGTAQWPLHTVLPIMRLLCTLDTWLHPRFRSYEAYRDTAFIHHSLTCITQELTARRELQSATIRTLGDTKVHADVAVNPFCVGSIQVGLSTNLDGKPCVQLTQFLANVPEWIETLYLEGTLKFPNLDIVAL